MAEAAPGAGCFSTTGRAGDSPEERAMIACVVEMDDGLEILSS